MFLTRLSVPLAFILASLCFGCKKDVPSAITASSLSGVKFYGDHFGETLRSFEGTSDGGYMFGGNAITSGSGTQNCFIQKCDKNGNVQWYNTYGIANEQYAFNIVHQTFDGGYIGAGAIWGNDSINGFDSIQWNADLIKTDANGTKLWQKNFAAQHGDFFYDFKETPDHGLVAVGFISAYNEDPIHVVKTDKNGDSLWTKQVILKNHNSLGASLAFGPDGSIGIAGYSESIYPDTVSIYYPTFTYLSSSGDLIIPEKTYYQFGSLPWTLNGNTWGFYYGPTANFEKIIARPDGFILLLATDPQPLSYNPYCSTCGSCLSMTVFKVNFTGNVLWNHIFTAFGKGVVFNDAIDNASGGLLISGGAVDSSGVNYCWLLNTDADGNKTGEIYIPVKGYSAWASGVINNGKILAIGVTLLPLLTNHAGYFGFLATDLNGKIIDETK